MAKLHPPVPVSDREMLIEVYAAVMAIREQIDGMCERCEEHNGRLNRLEGWKGVITGRLIVAASGASVIGIIAGWIGKSIIGGTP